MRINIQNLVSLLLFGLIGAATCGAKEIPPLLNFIQSDKPVNDPNQWSFSISVSRLDVYEFGDTDDNPIRYQSVWLSIPFDSTSRSLLADPSCRVLFELKLNGIKNKGARNINSAVLKVGSSQSRPDSIVFKSPPNFTQYPNLIFENENATQIIDITDAIKPHIENLTNSTPYVDAVIYTNELHFDILPDLTAIDSIETRIILDSYSTSELAIEIKPAIEIEFTTEPDKFYDLHIGSTLESLQSTGVIYEGTGSPIKLRYSRDGASMFYRVFELETIE